MTQQIRLFFDECLSEPALKPLKDWLLLRNLGEEAVHFFEKFQRGVLDDSWIPAIAAEGGWIVVTSDRGSQTSKGSALPRLCRDFRVTHVMLSAALEQRTMAFKIEAVIRMWESLVALHSAEPGSGHLLYLKGHVPALKQRS